MFNNTANQTQEEQKPEHKPAEHPQEDSGAKVIEPPQQEDTQKAAPPADPPPTPATQAAIEEQIAGLSVPKPSEDESGAPAAATSAPEPEAPAEAKEPKAKPAPGAGASEAPDELLSLKHEALEQLSPLVPHLDQNPEERFRTLMMMIQASDDHTKIKDAYQAAKKIEDDKVRAQALLDVVNEINYFTQNKQQGQK